ncbi:hypothetical protein [Gymnodinialimonas sp.]
MSVGLLLLILYVPGFILITYLYGRRTKANLWQDLKDSYRGPDYKHTNAFWSTHWRLTLSLGAYAAVVYIVLWIIGAWL